MYIPLRPHPRDPNAWLAPPPMQQRKRFVLPRLLWIVLGIVGVVLVLFAVLYPTLRHRKSESHTALAECSSPSCTGIIFPSITPQSFTPFPVPSDTPIANVFVETTPDDPPPTSDTGKVVPDFGQAWKVAHSKAKTRISSWSLEEKVATTTGVGWSKGLCVGNIPAIADWEGLCLEVC